MQHELTNYNQGSQENHEFYEEDFKDRPILRFYLYLAHNVFFYIGYGLYW